MTIKNPLTRELFEAGERFMFYDDMVTGSVYFEPNDEIMSNTVGTIKAFDEQYEFKKYRCNVKSINKSGFTVYGRHLGKWFDFRVKFSTCIHFPVEKPQPVSSPIIY